MTQITRYKANVATDDNRFIPYFNKQQQQHNQCNRTTGVWGGWDVRVLYLWGRDVVPY